jgi:hypothetical protein
MLDVSGELIDEPALENWIQRRGLMMEWEKAKN